jgi:UDP-N-acetylglucosamine 2-epimerase (non-hydrolysing)
MPWRIVRLVRLLKFTGFFDCIGVDNQRSATTVNRFLAMPITFAIVAGARPNFMKVAPLLRAFDRAGRSDAGVILVHTGQHYDAAMSDGFFRDLGIREPDVNLRVGSGSHAEQTARVMLAFEPVCLEKRPDWVVVVGDVNSTLACSLVAKKLNIAVAHVEAGLRSGDRTMPEEINRICTDAISDLLFTTDRLANENLMREGIPAGRIRFVGNTMIDTLIRNRERALATPLPDGFAGREYAVVTLHRPANVDDPERLGTILQALESVAAKIPLVFPAHPRTQKNLERFDLTSRLIRTDALRLTPPMSYLQFIGLIARSRFVLTDSGGIQEETTFLGVPCLTMRSNTERPITCTVGTNVLVGSDPEKIRSAAFTALDRSGGGGSIPEKWDGRAAERIVDVLLSKS